MCEEGEGKGIVKVELSWEQKAKMEQDVWWSSPLIS